MKVLIVGSGGREHAIAYSVAKSDKVDKIYCTPGNAGIAEFAECAPIGAMEFDKIVAFAKEKEIDLVIVGMDDPLVGGLVDELEAAGIRTFGPRKNAAILEGSKAFSKDLMKKYNIHSIRSKAYKATTNSNHNYPICQNLIMRNFTAEIPNTKWVGDITYIKTDEGWLYLAAVKDLCTKKIVGYAFSSRIDADLVVAALSMAVNRQSPEENLIFHSDRGVQYASKKYREALAEFSILQSMSRKGDPYDNAVAENFFSCLKNELVHHKHYKTRAEAQVDIFACIETYYNTVRPHSGIDWMAPYDYEKHLRSVYAAKVA